MDVSTTEASGRLEETKWQGGQTGQCPRLALRLLLLLDDVGRAQLLKAMVTFEEIKTREELMRELGKKRSAIVRSAPVLVRL
jgi:hypothetical protein